MVNEVMEFITSYDREVGEAIEAECARQRRNLELIASENIVSEPVMMAMGTVPVSYTHLTREWRWRPWCCGILSKPAPRRMRR